MSLTQQQRDNIALNTNTILGSSTSIVRTIAETKHIDNMELRKMEVVATANIAIAIATLIMFHLENAESTCILTAH